MIPLAIAIGIIEDKIANDLTGKDTKARECLEDVKAKISRHKPKQYKVTMIKADNEEQIDYCQNCYVSNGFMVREANGKVIGTSLTALNSFMAEPMDTEDDYVEGTTRGLVDL